MGMLEARERQAEVIEPVIEQNALNRDAKSARVCEVRQTETAGLVILAEDDILLWPGDRAPGPHAPFQRAPDIGVQARMAPPDLIENSNRPDARCWLSRSGRPRRPKSPRADRAGAARVAPFSGTADADRSRSGSRLLC